MWSADADIGAFLALGWAPPLCVIDLRTEFLRIRNGLPLQNKKDGLLGALAYFGEAAMGADEKESMRALGIRGGPFTEEEGKDLFVYCERDVDATERIFFRLWPKFGLSDLRTFNRAVWRGRYLGAVAVMRAIGVPLDTTLLRQLVDHWQELKLALIDKYGGKYGIYIDGSLNFKLFAELLGRWRLLPLWPRTRTGRLMTDDDTFEDMASKFPLVGGVNEKGEGGLKQLRQLRFILSKLKLIDLEVGRDGRNRVYFAPFATKTSRNAPTNSGFVYGPFKGLRNLIKPPRGRALAICDWAAQEFGAAAALSGDAAMWEAYATGDPHLATAKWFGLAPPDATKASHSEVREMTKALNFGVLYGMTSHGLSVRANISLLTAEDLITQHRGRFPQFWRWANRNVDKAMLGYPLVTRGGWPLCYPPMSGAEARARTAQNYLVQANCAEAMRYVAIRATEIGILVCCPIHDAFLIEAPIEDIYDAEATMCRIMGDVTEIVFGAGYRIEVHPRPSDKPKIYTWPNCYLEKVGSELFNTLVTEVARIERDSVSPMSFVA
jgi:hypothetical protein